MRSFGFAQDDKRENIWWCSGKEDQGFYGEVRGDEVHVLAQPYWLGSGFYGRNSLVRRIANRRASRPVQASCRRLELRRSIAEMKRTPLGTPLIWFKAPTSLLPHNGTIVIAFPEHQTDFEVELAIVIGKTAKNVDRANALDYVFGYTIGEDISDRDLQKSEKQFGRAKSFDTYTPVGPFVYTDVEVTDLRIELQQNGEVKQNARTSQMIYPVAEIVSFASQGLTLLPGDLILTGTPSGVGPIRAGDRLQATIGDWPPLKNVVSAAAP